MEHDEPDLSTDRAHSARVYDSLLGGKDDHAVDRAAAEAIMRLWPAVGTAAVVNRSFMHRAARYMAEQGVTQFLDIGTRVVDVDDDPLVLVHADSICSTGRSPSSRAPCRSTPGAPSRAAAPGAGRPSTVATWPGYGVVARKARA